MNEDRKYKPPTYRWRCVYCEGLKPRHYNEVNEKNCTCKDDSYHRGGRRWTDGNIVIDDPWWAPYYGIGCRCGRSHSPPSSYVSLKHRQDRQHVRKELETLKGHVDWEYVEDFDDPVNRNGPNSAMWDWW